MTDVVPSLHATDSVGSQYFPLHVYDAPESDAPLFDSKRASRKDGITDAGLAHFQSAYPGETLTKEDVFYYVYGILHSPDYRERYADNLGKELPRIPRVKTARDFWAFSKAGRALGELHVGYERVPEYAAEIEEAQKSYRVEKMRFGKGKDGKDKTVIHYNDFVTVRGVPLEAYDYVVNGKSAIEWVMERQSVTTDKASGIVKDANAWATETAGDPRYPLSLLLRVVTVSLETLKIVRALPRLEILEDAIVIELRRVTPKPEERFSTCVPLIELRAAAGKWSDVQEGLAELGGDHEWVTWDGAPKFTSDMFVARVTGKSMEPAIPDGAACLFRRVPLPSSPERAVLVRQDGKFTVKHFRDEKDRVVLAPANPAFDPIVVTKGEDVRVIAEVVKVLGQSRE